MALSEHFSNGGRDEHLSDTGLSLRLFKNQQRCVPCKDCREFKNNALIVELVYKQVSSACFDAFFTDVNAVPSQSKHLSHTQGASKGKVQGKLQEVILAKLNRFEKRICIPNMTGCMILLGEIGI